MAESKIISPTLEPTHGLHSHLLCWKSLFAGLLIAVMGYMILSSLGVAVLGLSAKSAIENETGGMMLLTGYGLWMGFSAIVSLFLGSYFTVRVSKNITNRVGAAHGFVLASAFFIIMSVVAASALGSLAMGFGHLVSGIGQGAASIGSNTRVQDTINQAFGTSTFKADPKVVAEGLTTRLLQGDVASAKSYYAYQTGRSEAEVSADIDTLNARFEATVKEVGDKAATAAAATGFTLFVLYAVGLIAAMFGGRVAAHANLAQPLAAEEAYTTHNHAPMFAHQRG